MTIDDKEWNNFIADFKVYKDKVDNLVTATKEQEHKISELERTSTKTDLQYGQIMEKLNNLINTTIPGLSAEIQAIKEKPAKRYDQIISNVITGIIGAVIGFIFSRILK